jgi:hypothetical protein
LYLLSEGPTSTLSFVSFFGSNRPFASPGVPRAGSLVNSEIASADFLTDSTSLLLSSSFASSSF